MRWFSRRREEPLVEPRPYDVLVFPIVDWQYLFQRPQQLSREFARRGHRVYYFATRFHPELCLWDPGAREVEPNVFLVTLPGSESPPDIYRDIPNELQLAAMEFGLRRLRETHELGATLSIVDYPFWAPLARKLNNNVVLYDCMDDYASFANAGRPARELEAGIVREADLVVCSSAHLQQRIGRESALLRNGVDPAHFETPPRALALEPNGRTAGYWGEIGDWTDIELLAFAARSLPDVRFVLIGEPRVDVSPLQALPNVTLTGRVPYERLPEYAHAFDVCLLPYRICDYARASDPLKVWEYLSAGKPVVAVRFAEIERLGELVTLTSTPEEFVAGIRRALNGNRPELAERRRAYARENTWSERCDAMQRLVEPLFPRRVWEGVGELDEEFGVGMFEDDDYTQRVRRAGHEIACAEDVFIHHHHSASFGQLAPETYQELFACNRRYYESKWGPWKPPVYRKELQEKGISREGV